MSFLLTELVAVFLLVDLLALRGSSYLLTGLDLHVLLPRLDLSPWLIFSSVLDFDDPSPFYNLFLSLLHLLMPLYCLQVLANHCLFLHHCHYRLDLRLFFIIRYFYYIIPLWEELPLLRLKLVLEKGKRGRGPILSK